MSAGGANITREQTIITQSAGKHANLLQESFSQLEFLKCNCTSLMLIVLGKCTSMMLVKGMVMMAMVMMMMVVVMVK